MDSQYFPGDSIMARRMRATTWAGQGDLAAAEWPTTLRVAIRLLLLSPAPLQIWWGPQHQVFHNDACLPLLSPGARDSTPGTPAHLLWPEVWESVGPVVDHVCDSRESVGDLAIVSAPKDSVNGAAQARRMAWSLSPILDLDGVTVEGLFVAAAQTPEVGEAMHRHASAAQEREAASVRASTVQANMEQQRLYEAILSNTPDLVYVFDLSYRLLYANNVLLESLSRTPANALGQTCRELGYAADTAALHEHEIDVVVSSRAATRGEMSLAGASGFHVYDFIFVPVFDANGAVIAVAGSSRDVTARKQIEEGVRRVASELSDSDRRKTEFLAMLAHELRNPLAPIMSGLRIVEMSDMHPVARQTAVAMLQRQVTHMVRLVDDLLDVSRINRGTIALRWEQVQLHAIVEQALDACRPMLEAANQKFHSSLVPPSVTIDGDVVRLSQVFSNLIGNASKFSPHDSTIWLSAEVLDGQVVVTLRDEGVGIPSEMRGSIFEMFTQLDRSKHRSQGGLGIGLTVVKSLIELHHGTVEARAAENGTGSEFVVTLPLQQPIPAVGGAPSAEDAGTLPPLRILIVDDNRDAALSLAMMLSLSGHDTHTAFDGQHAVDSALQLDPDVILLDIGLPVLDGYEACRRIRSQSRAASRAIMIALTGWGREDDRTQSFAAGFDAHLVKPVDDRQILTTIAGLRRAAHMARQDDGAARQRLPDGT